MSYDTANKQEQLADDNLYEKLHFAKCVRESNSSQFDISISVDDISCYMALTLLRADYVRKSDWELMFTLNEFKFYYPTTKTNALFSIRRASSMMTFETYNQVGITGRIDVEAKIAIPKLMAIIDLKNFCLPDPSYIFQPILKNPEWFEPASPFPDFAELYPKTMTSHPDITPMRLSCDQNVDLYQDHIVNVDSNLNHIVNFDPDFTGEFDTQPGQLNHQFGAHHETPDRHNEDDAGVEKK